MMEKISWVIVERSRCIHVALHPKEERKIERISLHLQSNGSVSFNFDLECRLFFHLISMGYLHEKQASEHEDRSHRKLPNCPRLMCRIAPRYSSIDRYSVVDS